MNRFAQFLCSRVTILTKPTCLLKVNFNFKLLFVFLLEHLTLGTSIYITCRYSAIVMLVGSPHGGSHTDSVPHSHGRSQARVNGGTNLKVLDFSAAKSKNLGKEEMVPEQNARQGTNRRKLQAWTSQDALEKPSSPETNHPIPTFNQPVATHKKAKAPLCATRSAEPEQIVHIKSYFMCSCDLVILNCFYCGIHIVLSAQIHYHSWVHALKYANPNIPF